MEVELEVARLATRVFRDRTSHVLLVERPHELIKAFIFLGNPWFIYPGSDQGHSYSFSLRKPRFFFVTTSSVTETLRTNSLCYVTAGAGFSGECKRRKKRSLFRTGRLPWYDAVQPTKLIRGDEAEYSEDESSSYEADGREGRFLLYWITTTSRSTTTIYSSTYSVHSVECTPNPANLC